MAQKWIMQEDGTFKPAGSTTKKWKKKADGTFEEVQSAGTTAGTNSTSGGITSGNTSGITSGSKTGITVTGSNTTSGLTGLSAGISTEQQARLTAEENILKQYGTYEQFQQKNAAESKVTMTPAMKAAMQDTMDKAEQGAYEKLIQDETERLLSESYYAYELYMDDIDSKSQTQETDVLTGLDDETKELLQLYAMGYSEKDADVYSGNAFGQADIRAANKKSAKKALKKKGYSEEEIETLAGYTQYYSAESGEQRGKSRAWVTKERGNLETLRAMDEEDITLLQRYVYGYGTKEEEAKVKASGAGGGAAKRANKMSAKKALEKKGYSAEEIKSLAATLESAENANSAEEWREEVAKKVNRSAVDAAAYSAASVTANLVSGAGLVPAVEAKVKEIVTGEYVPIDTNDPLYRPGEFRDIVRTNVAQNIEDSVDSRVAKKVLPMVYNAGMSTADTLTASALGGALGGTAKAGEVLSLVAMSAGAASSSTQEAFNRTGDTGKSLATGIAAGVIEYATEKISLDHLWDIIQKSGSAAGKSMVLNILAQAGIEGSEEGASEIANRIVDDWINGGMSQYNQNVKQYMAGGADEAAAKKQATNDFIAQVVDSVSTGALAGLMGAGAGTLLSTKPSKNAQAVIDAEVNSRIAAKEESGKKLTMKQKAAIREQVETDLAEGSISVDTIEKTLGGDTYEKYRTALEQEETLKKAYEEAGNKTEEGLSYIEKEKQRKAYEEAKAKYEDFRKNSNQAELKKQLSSEMAKLAGNDEFLRESYNEQGRRRDAYQVDESRNYSAKEREIIRKAADSGILNNTRRTHKFIDLIAKIAADKGISFDFTNNTKLKESGFALAGKSVNGFVQDGTVTLNIQSSRALETVVGHEIAHVLEGTEMYPALQQAVKEYATTKGEYDSRLAELTELYKGVEGANIENELTADLIGEYLFTDADFVKNLSAKHQNLFQKIYSEIKYLLKTATAGSGEARQLEKVKKVFQEVYRENSSAQTETGVKYSLAGVDENGIEVYETSEDTKSLSYAERKAKLLDTMKNEYAGRTAKFTKNGETYYALYDNKGIRKGVYGDKKSDLKGYNAKINIGADGNYIELAENALYAGSAKEQGKSNAFHKNAQSWDYYVKTVKCDGNYFDVLINVKDTGNSQYVYDITLKEATHQYATKHLRLGEAASKNSVPQNQQNASGNLKNSLSDQNDTAPIDSRLTYGSDITLEQDNGIPIRQDIAGKEIAPAQKQQADDIFSSLRKYTADEESKILKGQDRKVLKTKADIEEFVEGAVLNNERTTFGYLGVVTPDIIDRIRNEITEISDSNKEALLKREAYSLRIRQSEIKHLQKAGMSLAETKDYVAKIPQIVSEFDSVRYTIENRDGQIIQGMRFEKTFSDGKMYSYLMVSNKKGTLTMKTTYLDKSDYKKKKHSLLPDAQSATGYTSETGSSSASINSIPQSAENVTQNIENDDTAGIPIRQDIQQPETDNGIPIREDTAVEEVRPSESPQTVKEANQIKRDNYRIELERIEKEARKSHQDFNEDIAEKQAEYDRKKDKNTKAARDLQRRIDSLKTRRDNTDADYERRANHLREQIAKMGTEKFKRAEQRQTKTEQYRKQMRELIGNTSTWVDKKLGISYQVNTLKRNLRDIVRTADGKRDIARADAIYDELQGTYNHHEALLNREANEIKDKYRKLDINKWEDAYIQMLGEYKYNPDCELAPEKLTEFYTKHKDQIDTAKVDAVIEDVRKLYDSLFERVNEALHEQGMKEIGYREGYFPHFTQDGQGWLAKLLNWKTKSDNIPTDIAGLTENFNPERSWQSFDKHRTGDTTDYSFKKGLDSYVNGALDWIYHIEDIQKRRAFENEIRYSHSEQGIQEKLDAIYKNEEYDADEVQEQIDAVLKEAENPLNNFVTDFRNATNNLAGKKSTADRGLEYATNRKVYSTMTNISNRVSANMVGGSISSAMTNFIPITQSWSDVSPVSSLKAMRETIKSYIRDDGMVGQSDFLTNRLEQTESLYESGWDKANKAVGYMMDCIDSFTSQVVWRSKYMENVKSGMEQQEAIKNADNFTEGLMAGRSRGNMPTIFNSKNPVTKLFTAFQLEVANQYGYMFKDMPQDIGSRSKFRLAKGYASMFVGAYVYNALYSSLTGRDSAFDPIGIIEDLLKDLGVTGDDDDKEEEWLGVVGNLAENLLDEMPFVGGLLGGGRVPISSAFPYDDPVSTVTGTLTDISDGDWKGLTSEWLNPVYYLVMPMGGGQLRKTVQGLSMFNDNLPVSGSYTNSGDLRFPVEDTVGNRIQAALFGQYANKNARDYFDSGQSPLNEKQIQEYKDLDIPIQDYWDYRNGLKGLTTMEEKTEYIAGLDLPVSKKNILINNASSRKDPIDLTGYENFKDFEEFDFSIKNPEKYEFLKDNDISYEEYSEYEGYKEAYDWAYQNQEKFEVAKAVAGGAVEYRRYAKAIDAIEADRNSSGTAVSGSRKRKVADYINGLDLERGQKLLLYKDAYPSDDSYNQEIVEYLNSRKDISYKGMETILKELGFTIGANGIIYW